MIKIAICDDDLITLNHTKKLIEDFKVNEFKVECYQSGEELLESNEKFQIILLDIDMNGINGIETAKKIRVYDKQVKIIYVTNYTDYTSLAFVNCNIFLYKKWKIIMYKKSIFMNYLMKNYLNN